MEAGKAKYEIVIKTNGEKAEATTNADVFIQLIGKYGLRTESAKLTRFWRRFFRQGNTDTFELSLDNVGMPLLVHLKVESSGNEAVWGCDYVLVTYKGDTKEYPVYDWITDSITASAGKAVLPQRIDDEWEKESRNEEKERNKLLYQWSDKDKVERNNSVLPRHIKASEYSKLPIIFKYDDRFVNGSNKARVRQFRINAAIQKLKNYFFGIAFLDDYNRFHEYLQSPSGPAYLDRWMEDEEFGRHMLNGSSRSVRRCRGLPSNCKITDQHLEGLLEEGKSLDEEIVKGKIYIVDPSAVTLNVSRSTQYGTGQLYCADATALFYSTQGKFLPLAIQLEPRNAESVFTPKDENYDWLLAKMYFRCADYNVSEYGHHFMTHIVLGPITIALFRCLPRAHPVHKLLRPHLSLVMAANSRGLDFFFNREVAGKYRSQGATEQTNQAYKYFDFRDLNFPKTMEKRGLMDSELLPKYYFRDDALLYWEAIEKLTGRVIHHYYDSDNDVVDDDELQDWIKEIVEEGYTYHEDMSTSCPNHLDTIHDLVLFTTNVIFNASVYHAALHFPQYDMYKFIPNAPAGMRLPIHKKGEGSLQRVLNSLPDKEMAVLQVGVSYVAAGLDDGEILLGQYPKRYFTEPEAIAMLDQFSDDIKAIGNIIKQRNEERDIPYEYLLPERIPATITQ